MLCIIMYLKLRGGEGVELRMSIAPQDAICAPVVQVTADISKGDVSVNLG